MIYGLVEPAASDERRTWAAAVLAELPTTVGFSDLDVQEWTAPDGILYRQAFTIIATPNCRFLIKLRNGATRSDLAEAQSRIDSAKKGQLSTWIERPDKRRGGSFWAFARGVQQTPNAEPSSVLIKACDRPGCVDTHHEILADGRQFDYHGGEHIDHPEHAYSVGIYAADNDPWEVSAECDTIPDGPAGLKMLRDFTNDYAWMQGEADRLNAAALAADGSADPSERRAA